MTTKFSLRFRKYMYLRWNDKENRITPYQKSKGNKKQNEISWFIPDWKAVKLAINFFIFKDFKFWLLEWQLKFYRIFKKKDYYVLSFNVSSMRLFYSLLPCYGCHSFSANNIAIIVMIYTGHSLQYKATVSAIGFIL